MGKAKAIVAFTWSLLLSANAVFAQTGQDKEMLGQIEQRLFMRTYDKDTPTARLERIERNVFGQAVEGNFADRLGKVNQMVAAPPPEMPAPAPQKPAQPVADDQEAAIERARVQVQAAKEEQANKLMAEGVQLYKAKRPREALEKFEQVLKLDPQNADAHFSMGIIYESAGNFVEAEQAYGQAAQNRPDKREYQEALAQVAKKVKAKAASEQQNGEVRSLAEAASAAYQRKEWFSALDLYKQLDAKVPNQALVKYNIGSLYLVMKNPQMAADYYKEAVRLKPDEPRYSGALNKLQLELQQQEARDRQEQEEYNRQMQAQGMPVPGNQKVKKEKKQKEPKVANNNNGNFPNPTNYNNNFNNPNNGLYQPAPPAGQDAMTALGIIAKSSRDGVQITEIGLASRAARIGLTKGDVIKAVNGTVVNNPREVNDILSRTPPNAPVQMMIQRNKQMTLISL